MVKHREVMDRGERVVDSGDGTHDHRVRTDPVVEGAGRIVLVEESATHAVGETLAVTAEVEDGAVGHVFATEFAESLDHGGGPGVADRKAVTGLTFDEQPPAGGTEQGEVADQHVAADGR